MEKARRWLSVAAGLLMMAGAAYPAGRVIYPDPGQAKADLAAAIRRAEATHKRVIVDFGGNWCGDCQVLDIYFHNAENLPLLERNYVLVHVNIGRFDANLEMAKRYRIPLKLGVPALAVLSSHGKLIYSQEHGEFEKMQRIEPATVTEFLIRWKPIRPGCSAVMVNC
ncbi:MAG TPA: thioredoxin family protein [Terracidiphilus sp.]|nr:thioredoxin family protein [Terracidiphilus sp.]